jgi:hypothetical protein
MRYNILIAGAGQLGSRYLQGLSFTGLPLNIYVYDISKQSLKVSKERWEEMGVNPNSGNIYFIDSMMLIPKALDLAIISSTADVRLAIISQINKFSNVKKWVLEKILAQSSYQLDLLAMNLGGSSVWVNTPMLQWSLYRNLALEIAQEKIIKAEFLGSYGLVCNSVHYIDLLSRLNHANPERIDVSNLDNKWYESKRAGFYDVYGKLVIYFSDGSKLSLVSNPNNLDYAAKILTDNNQWEIFEHKGIALSQFGKSVNGRCEYQSEFTHDVVESILLKDSCNLPTFQQSVVQHKVLIEALLEHWNLHMNRRVSILPVT